MRYEDIIHLPYPRPSRHPRMSQADRAAQFSPFSALTGYEEAIQETARRTDSRITLAETAAEELNQKLSALLPRLPAAVTVTHFVPDLFKEGGSYQDTSGRLKTINGACHYLEFTDGTLIWLADVLDICESDP